MKIYILLWLLSSFLYSCSTADNEYAVPQNKIIVSDDFMSPIFAIRDIEMSDPAVIMIDSVAYVSDMKNLRNFTSFDKSNIVRYLTKDLWYFKWQILHDLGIKNIDDYIPEKIMQNHITDDILDNLEFTESINGNKIYRFRIKPKKFVLMLVSADENWIFVERGKEDLGNKRVIWNLSEHLVMKEDNGEGLTCHSDYVSGMEFSRDYILALSPVYSWINRHRIMQYCVDKYVK